MIIISIMFQMRNTYTQKWQKWRTRGPKEVVESSGDMEEQERESTYVADTC